MDYGKFFCSVQYNKYKCTVADIVLRPICVDLDSHINWCNGDKADRNVKFKCPFYALI